MNILRIIGVGIIFLTFSLTPYAETQESVLVSLIDKQFAKLETLDLIGVSLDEEQRNAEDGYSSYAQNKTSWWESYKKWAWAYTNREYVLADFNARCNDLNRQSRNCLMEEQFLENNSLDYLNKERRRLREQEHELALEKEGLIKKLGKNNTAGLTYLHNRMMIVAEIQGLQLQLQTLKKDYAQRVTPSPRWRLK